MLEVKSGQVQPVCLVVERLEIFVIDEIELDGVIGFSRNGLEFPK